MEITEISSKAVKSILALFGRTVFLQAVNLVAFFLLGVFLSAEAIGIFIVVTAAMRFLMLFTEVGLGAALVQKRAEVGRKDLVTTFTLQEVLVFLATAAGFMMTSYVARFARLDAAGIGLYWAVLGSFAINSFKTIPSILLERKLAFDKQIIPQIAEALVFNILLVFLAWRGFGVGSYTWAILAAAVVGLPIYYLISPWKIGLGIDFSRARRLLSYGIAFQGKNVLAVLKDDLLTFVLAGMVGTTAVGYWGWAQRWAYSPFRLIVDSITKVTFPAYARLQNNKEALREGIEKSLFTVSLVLFPILSLMVVLAPSVIQLVPRYIKWVPALPSFYFLCAGAAVSALSNILVNALDATGRVKTTLTLMIMWVVLTWGATIWLVNHAGFTGIAAASLLVSLTIFVTIYLVKRIISFSFLANVVPPAAGSILLGMGVFIMLHVLPSNIFSLALAGGVGVIIYAAAVLLLAGEKIKENIRLVHMVLRK